MACSTSKALKNFVISGVIFATLAAVLVSGFQYEVGDKGRGWKIPTGNEPETYNEWAAKNRFHVGDAVFFKYDKDSVLVVNSDDYSSCNTSNPISKYENGDTVFKFDRSGLFYFISGQSGHCKSGQRLIIRVMHPSNTVAPATAPSPSPGPAGDSGGNSGGEGLPAKSSTAKLFVVSYVMTGLVGLCVMVYLFM